MMSERKPEIGRVMPFAKLCDRQRQRQNRSGNPKQGDAAMFQTEIARDGTQLGGHHHAAKCNQQIDRDRSLIQKTPVVSDRLRAV